MSTPDPALEQLRSAAAEPSPQTWFQLAQGLVARQAMEEAHDWHRRAADAGFAPAQIELARMQLHGVGTERNVEEAVAWLLRAEATGHPVAAYMLALVSVGGVAAPHDARINQRVMQALNAGMAPALRAAAIHFGRKANAQDQQRCLQLLDHAAQRGDWVAALLLSERLARGEGCAADRDAAGRLRARLEAGGIAPLPALSVEDIATRSTAGTLLLEDGLQAPLARAVSERPRVAVIDGLLSADECRLLIAAARPMLHRSLAIDERTGEASAMQIRTSSDASFDPLVEDLSLRLVQQRMASAAGMELVQAEHLVVLAYEPGQEYRPHRDYRSPESLRDDVPEAGNRARTICVYLNEPEAGGETAFPVSGVTVEPQAGRAVVFDNLLADGSPDVDSLHAGLPVQHGEKWLATLWLRERGYRAY
ncbi:2OG-Fe(II) oxygenase [Lysobacter yangpyeongensis]|uniref:2OG-Fe(II) oxygenase n=1 Tax=Lysobacter yangpyeongensis TaxID=346182 RepID=A0ABW0SI32_9GAMM